MRRVSAEELREWADTNYSRPFPCPPLDMLKEMEDEGMIFELHSDDKGNEYPQINYSEWKSSGSEESS